MRIFVVAAGLIAFAPQGLGAAQPAGDSSTQTRASQGAQETTVGTVTGEKVVCRSDKEIGSRVKARKVCMTPAQWAVRTAEQRQYIEQRQAQRTISTSD